MIAPSVSDMLDMNSGNIIHTTLTVASNANTGLQFVSTYYNRDSISRV